MKNLQFLALLVLTLGCASDGVGPLQQGLLVPSDTTRLAQVRAPQEVGAAPFYATGAVTGAALKQILGELLGDIQARAHILGDELATKLSNEVKVAIAQLDGVLGERLTKPLNELNATMRAVADRATVIAVQTRIAVDATVKCAGTDAQLIAQSTAASFAATGDDVSFWSEEVPFVGVSYALGDQSRLGMYAGREPTPFRLMGSYPGLLPQRCGMPTVVLESQGHVEVPVVAADRRSIVVVYPTLTQTGVLPVTIKYREEAWIGCESKATEVKTFLVVAPAPEFKVSYTALASCGVYERQTKSMNVWVPNEECNGDKHGNLALCVDPGWEFDSTSVRWHGCSGDKDHFHYRDGNCGRATWTVPEQGGFACTGGNKSGGAELFVTQRRRQVTPAREPIKGTSTRPAYYNTSMRMAVFDPLKPPPVQNAAQKPWECQWTVSASIKRPNGTTTDIPAKTGVGALTAASADGIAYEWNPMDGSITVIAPPYSCEYLQ